jgi:hypothetical protein
LTVTPDAMTAQLQATADRFGEARRRLVALVDGMPNDVFNGKPGPKAWSVGECVVHLNTVSKGYLPVLEAAAARPEPRGEGPFRYGFVARRFIDALRPGSRPIPTAPSMRPPPARGPRSTVDRHRALARFHSDTERYLDVVEAADGLDLARIKVRSPFLPVVRLPLGAFLEALSHHAVRHVAQAERAAAEAA